MLFQLEEIIQNGLEGNEYVSLLSWVMNTYPGVELMSHPDLKVDLSIISPLIRTELLQELEQKYLKVSIYIERNFSTSGVIGNKSVGANYEKFHLHVCSYHGSHVYKFFLIGLKGNGKNLQKYYPFLGDIILLWIISSIVQ